MKNTTARKLWIYAAALSMWCGCSDADDIKNRVRDQNERLTALENLVETVNDNTLAIAALFDETVLIKSFAEKKNASGTVAGYVLSLDNGQDVEVTFGDRLDAVVPVIGIDSQGRFIYSMDGGATFSPVEGAANATAADGLSPKIALDADGYWTISVDGGQTWTRMLDDNHLPVNAFQANSSEGSAFFADIRFDAQTGIMHFDLKTGDSLQIRVKNITTFTVKHYTEGDEVFLGEEMKYLVEYTHVKQAFFTVPEGWRATLDDECMKVYAPASGTAGTYDILLTLVSPTGMLKNCTFPFTLNATPVQAKWKLDWEDDFDKGVLDPAAWALLPRANTTAKRYMSSDPRCYEFRDGCYVMKAIKNDNLQADTATYLTGGIYSRYLKEFTPGRIEVRAKIKGIQGTQPAIWTGTWSGPAWPYGGEIDIMEHYNVRQQIYQTIHSHYTYDLGFDTDPVPQVMVPLDPAEFHVYGVELWPDELIFLVDGVQTLSYPRRPELPVEYYQFPFHSSVYLILDIQIIGDWGGAVDESALPGEIEIDWVRHYLWK